MVICLERGADLHVAQLMPLPLTVSCFSKIQIGFTFLVPAYLDIPGKWAVKRVCVYVSRTIFINKDTVHDAYHIMTTFKMYQTTSHIDKNNL